MADEILRTYTVYGLRDSRDGAVRYIGQTITSLRVRLKCHMSEANTIDNPKGRWIKSVVGCGGSVEIFAIVDMAEKDVEEIAQIRVHRDMGCDLLNLTGGGSGMMNCLDATRRKMSASSRARFADPAERLKTSVATKLAMSRPEVAGGLSAACVSRWASAEERKKQSVRTSAVYADPAARAAQAERRAKMSNAQVIEARRLRKEGVLISDLCAMFGIAAGPMSMLCNGKTFKHLPM